MDVFARNEYLRDHNYLIKAAIRRNMTLLRALRLEIEDVYQELAVAMLKAVKDYDPRRSASLDAHVNAKLQYAIQDIKRTHKPYGMTGLRGSRVTITSIESFYDDRSFDIPDQDAFNEVEVSDILAMLTPEERSALRRRMDGYNTRAKSGRDMLAAAREKLTEYYTRETYCVSR